MQCIRVMLYCHKVRRKSYVISDIQVNVISEIR